MASEVAPDGHVLDELALARPEHLAAEYVAGCDRKAAFMSEGDLTELREIGLETAATVALGPAGVTATARRARARRRASPGA